MSEANQQPKAKTFTERFQELEVAVSESETARNVHRDNLTFHSQQIRELDEMLERTIIKLQATLSVLEKKALATQVEVETEILNIQVNKVKGQLAALIADNKLALKDGPVAAEDIISFDMNEAAPFSYTPVQKFTPKFVEAVLGKKAGDSIVVGLDDGKELTINIIDVYSLVIAPSEPAMIATPDAAPADPVAEAMAAADAATAATSAPTIEETTATTSVAQ
jgi:hypothetical protein